MTRKNDFNWPHFIELTKKRYKKKFGKPVKATEIRRVVKEFLNEIIDRVVQGGLVRIDKHSSIEVVGRSILQDDIFKLLVKGKSIRRDGTIKNAEFSSKRKDFKYKIVYKNKLNPNLYFNADSKFAKKVHKAITNTNTYYRIDEQNGVHK